MQDKINKEDNEDNKDNKIIKKEFLEKNNISKSLINDNTYETNLKVKIEFEKLGKKNISIIESLNPFIEEINPIVRNKLIII